MQRSRFTLTQNRTSRIGTLPSRGRTLGAGKLLEPVILYATHAHLVMAGSGVWRSSKLAIVPSRFESASRTIAILQIVIHTLSMHRRWYY